ncbi:MAG TPA: acyltransferase family protein [Candidatus Didemnitutus sp.]|jgi:peptidoglycan/LPS O-acetylase OafA/YrhL
MKASQRKHDNAFDLLRLVLALLVVYTHAHLLGAFGEEPLSKFVRSQTSAGTLAVLGFFGLSGFLVTQSFEVQGDGLLFARARLLRILPGLYLALVLTAFVFAPCISHFGSAAGGWNATEATGYIVRNALVVVREWNIGRTLAGLPYEGSLNGALWSLFPECICYGVVLLLGLLGSIPLRRVNVLMLLVVVYVFHVILVVSPGSSSRVPTVLSLTGWAPDIAAFLTGSAVYLYRQEVAPGGNQAWLWLLVSAGLLKFGGWVLLAPLVLPLALIHGAHLFRVRLPFDLSYGIYVLHFPVLQLLSAIGLHHQGFVRYFGAGVFITILFAAVSWFLVERPSLAFKRTKVSETPARIG